MSKALKKTKNHMAPINLAPASTERTKMLRLFTDTTCGPESGSSSWKSMYKLLEDEKPNKVQRKETVDAPNSSKATIEELANYFLHRIVARPKILPYTDMVR